MKNKVGVSASPATSPHRSRIAFVCLALVAVTCAAYWRVQENGFVNYDDPEYVTENPHVLHGLSWPDVKWAFTTGHTGYAHPVTWLTHQIDYQLYGAWAGGHHLTNLAIHVVNSLLLFLLFWRITRDLWPSAFVAALFAIHPLHVESVAWVAERKDVLSGLFFMLTLHAYAAYVIKRQVWRYVLALCLFVLGILSKPMLVSMPCVLLLFDYWPLHRVNFQRRNRDRAVWSNIRSLILEKVPFALVAGAWSILTFSLQKEAGAVGGGGIALRIGNAIVSYATYCWSTLWPQNLAVFYPYPLILPWGTVIISATLLVLVSILCVATKRSSPYLIVGWCWYLGMLAPVIGLVQAGDQARADRYTYLPQIGLWFALSWEVAALTKSWALRRYLLPVAATVVIAFLAVRTWNQTAVWHDSESLWTHTLAVTSGNLTGHYSLGNVLARGGRYDEAVSHFAEALRINPNYVDALSNMGLALRKQGKAAEAIPFYEQALRVAPDSVRSHWQLGLALADQGKNSEALQEFLKAVELAPNDFKMRMDLGLTLTRQGKLAEAILQLKEAVRLRPDSAEAHNDLGLVFLMADRPEESLPHFSAALRLKPDLAAARDNLKRAQKQIDARPK